MYRTIQIAIKTHKIDNINTHRFLHRVTHFITEHMHGENHIISTLNKRKTFPEKYIKFITAIIYIFTCIIITFYL